MELFGYDVENEPQDTWSPEKLAVYLTRKFNFSKKSPLYQKIKLAPLYSEIDEIVNKEQWLLSTAAMVEGIMSLISSNPQKDRDMLAMKRNSIWEDKTRQILSDNGGASAIEGKSKPSFSSADTSNSGMHADTDDKGKTYYYRGEN